MTVVVAIVSDTHPNSTVGLFAPEGIRDEDGVLHSPSEAQLQLWEWWLDYWQAVEKVSKSYKADSVYAIIAGDGADDNSHSKHGLVILDRGLMAELSAKAHEPARKTADKLFWVKGTPAHVGEYAVIEEAAAQKLGAVQCPQTDRYTWWYLHMKAAGVLLDVEHHPQTNSYRPWTHAAYRQSRMVASEYNATGDIIPHVAIRGHTHQFDDSGIATRPRTIYLPPWQLTTSFGHKKGFRLSPVGGIILVCHDDGQYILIPRLYTPERERPWQE
jgi:hypothetical protein